MENYLISLTVFIPFFGALLQSLNSLKQSRWIALGSSLIASFFGIWMVASMKNHIPGLQVTEVSQWIGSYAISYEMGLDGLNALLVLLISILFPILIASEWNQKIGVRGIQSLFLILQTALFGTVFAQDLFLQFFFLGMTSIPFYFLIGIWGGQDREKAAFKLIVTSAIGTSLFFAALILIYYSIEPHSFSMKEFAGNKLSGKSFEFMGNSLPVSTVAFILISLGLSLRAPIWPFHGWFCEVAQEAPSSVFVSICAGLVPVVMYVFMKVSYLLFPETLSSSTDWIIGVGTVNLIMGGFCAVAQKRLSGLLAFICLSEVGLVLVGVGSLNAIGMVGAIYQLLVFGMSLAAFGLMIGLIRERTHQTYFMNSEGQRTLGGIVIQAPYISLLGGIIVISLLGLPGLAGFIGHALIVMGSFSIYPGTIILMIGAFLLASYYLFMMYRNVFLGEPGVSTQDFVDLTLREKMYLIPLVFGLLFFGLYPKPWVELIRPTVLTLISIMK